MLDTYDYCHEWLQDPTEDQLDTAPLGNKSGSWTPDVAFIDPAILGLNVETSAASVLARTLARRNDPSWAPICAGLAVTFLLGMVFTFTRLTGEAARYAPTWSAGGAAFQFAADRPTPIVSHLENHRVEREVPCAL
jgi:hypothetical protein